METVCVCLCVCVCSVWPSLAAVMTTIHVAPKPTLPSFPLRHVNYMMIIFSLQITLVFQNADTQIKSEISNNVYQTFSLEAWADTSWNFLNGKITGRVHANAWDYIFAVLHSDWVNSPSMFWLHLCNEPSLLNHPFSKWVSSHKENDFWCLLIVMIQLYGDVVEDQ